MNHAIVQLTIIIIVLCILPVFIQMLKKNQKEDFRNYFRYRPYYWRRRGLPGSIWLGLYPYRYSWLNNYYYDPYYGYY